MHFLLALRPVRLVGHQRPRSCQLRSELLPILGSFHSEERHVVGSGKWAAIKAASDIGV